ncbi:hypothetical protein P3342_002939 [Pyrenophora teres f. teres]|nr:hypothetical protein P3342_002939 [Pyrenophora teres f. teres]
MVAILVLTSFLLLLDIINAALDGLLNCGLLGQVLVGMAWGVPGAQWLAASFMKVASLLSFPSLKASLLLSSAVALTGIALPISLSYTLQGLLDATPVQAFAAGAALCSTSLGTTFTLLASSGLASSRLGVVLTSAAMMDDVVGLPVVMVQVISNLGDDSFSWVNVVRAVLVSVTFALIAPTHARLNSALQKSQAAFTIHTLSLIGLVTGATYEVDQKGASKHSHQSDSDEATDQTRVSAIYEHYYQPAVSKILQPFFLHPLASPYPLHACIEASLARSTPSSLGQRQVRSHPHADTFPDIIDKRHKRRQKTVVQCTKAMFAAPAMCARGEIGFLIPRVAESRGVFSADGKGADESSDMFLIVTWAIVLCTIMGPLGVGLAVRRVKKLESRKDKEEDGARRHVVVF